MRRTIRRFRAQCHPVVRVAPPVNVTATKSVKAFMKSLTKLLAGLIAFVLITGASSNTKLNDRERALHALNRLAFGPRPGDVDAVMKDGVNTWIEQQLHPEAIPDRAVEARIT